MTRAGAASSTAADGSPRRALLPLLLAAFALRFGAALAFPNVLWPDEIFQTLEQAHRLAFGYGLVPWEFREGTRSWLLPGALAAVLRATAFLGPGSAGYLAAASAALCGSALVPVAVAFRWSRDRGLPAAVSAGAACAVWFELVYFAPKALTEVVAAHALLGGLYLADRDREAGGPDASACRAAAAGAVLALAVALRVHLLPAVLVAALACSPGLAPRWRWAAAGAGAVVLAAGALDAVTWGRPFASFVRNVQMNLVEGRSRSWGVAPPGWYLRALAAVWGPAAPVLLALAALGARRRPALAAAAAAALASHAAVAHKEYRFVYPVVLAAVVLAALGTADVVSWIARRRPGRGAVAAALATLAWAALSAARAPRFTTSATSPTSQPGELHWLRGGAVLRAFAAASRGPAPCGVGVVGIDPWFTGGYSHLHRDVPIHAVAGARELDGRAPAFDLTIARLEPSLPLRAEDAERCHGDGVCVFRRDGGCRPMPGALPSR